MRKKFSFTAVCLLAAGLFVCASAEDKVDVTKPVIQLNAPEEGGVLFIGRAYEYVVHFDMDISDDVMLKSYEVEVKSDFKSKKTKSAKDTTVVLSFKQEYDVSGKNKEHIHHHDIKIPIQTKPGKYLMTVICHDAAGNEAREVRHFVLKKEEAVNP